MYIVYGVSTKKVELAKSTTPLVCNRCGTTDYWKLYRAGSYFNLFFFLRLFPVSKKVYYYACPSCRYEIPVTSQNINYILGQVQMTEKLSKELNSDRFKKYLARVDANTTVQQ